MKNLASALVALALSTGRDLQAQAAAQSERPVARPLFEVASVKPNPPSALRHVIYPPTGNRFHTTDASVRLLIQYAYSVQTFEISAGPDWMNTAGYEIDAKAEGSPTRSEMRVMLQALLEDRFKLKLHRDMKKLPMYALVAGKGGVNLAKPKEGDCTDLGTVTSGKDQHPVTSPCGDAVLMGSPSGMEVRGRQIAMTDFTKLLSGIVGRPVIDKIGVTGNFDINVEFACDEFTPGIPCPDQLEEPASKPSIIGALQRQLGLKLESAKAPVEVIVIDHLERPTEN